MNQREPVWRIIDRRTGKVASIASFFTEDQALNQITAWYVRHWRGGRPDVTLEDLDNLAPKQFPAGVFPDEG